MTVFEKIEAQQKGKGNTAPWMAGVQLKDICRADSQCAELVDKGNRVRHDAQLAWNGAV